ncbi:MAG: hypothetical protein PHS44_06065 [Candidatus Dojkabacteria bacterium]|nr:hypothetical protein [Candidatus Dojkabacteria bacterium]
MKFKYNENPPDYSNYNFPYRVYLIREEKDSLDNIYQWGFLPSRVEKNLFYLARSTRIDLREYSPSSENRRILRKTEYLGIEIVDLKNFDYDYKIGKMGRDFYAKRGEGKFSAYKIKWLFTSGTCSHIIVFRDLNQKGNNVAGYCLINKTNELLHYSYPFYDLKYLNQNAGIGMMTRSIIEAQKLGLKYCYLGTSYTESSLYKTQFRGFEFFDGEGWNDNIEELKKLVE